MHRILLTAIAGLGLIGLAHAETIQVPGDHATIQAAVDAAANGDTIQVKGGKYAEDVVVAGKTDLTIVGKGKVTLLPSVTGLLANNCTNLVIQKIGSQGGTNGFDFQDCAGVRLENFSVKDVSFDGVHAVASTDVRLIKGKITDCGHDGVSFSDEEPTVPVIGGEITSVKIKNCDEDGIDLLARNITVTSCSVKDVGDDAFESEFEGGGSNTFDRCSAKNSGDEGFEIFAPNCVLTNCKSINAGDDAFDIEGTGSRLENCKSVKAGENGLEIEVTERVTLLNCKAVKSADSGISVQDSTDCIIDGCKASGSRDSGFFLDSGTSGCILRNNKASKSGDSDLTDESGGANTIEDNNKFKTVDT
jgi:parallel beta-helix repeat protein